MYEMPIYESWFPVMDDKPMQKTCTRYD